MSNMRLVLCCRCDADCVATRPGLGVCAGGGEVPHLLPDCRTCQVSTFLGLFRNLMFLHRHMYTHTHTHTHKPSHTCKPSHTHTNPHMHTHPHTHTKKTTSHTRKPSHTHTQTLTRTQSLFLTLSSFTDQHHVCAPVPTRFCTFLLTLPSSHSPSEGPPSIKT